MNQNHIERAREIQRSIADGDQQLLSSRAVDGIAAFGALVERETAERCALMAREYETNSGRAIAARIRFVFDIGESKS